MEKECNATGKKSVNVRELRVLPIVVELEERDIENMRQSQPEMPSSFFTASLGPAAASLA